MRLLYLFFPVLVTVFLGTAPAHSNDFQNVSLLGRWAEGPCLALAAEGEVTFFGNGAYLDIVDFSSPNGLVLLSHLPLAGPVLGVDIAGGLACVANGSAGLRVIDISDPTQAYQSGVYLSTGCVEEVALNGIHAYLAAGDAGLRVVDISDPTTPFEAGFLDTPGYADDIVVSGSVAYLGDGTSLRIIDVSNSADPVEIGFLPTSSEYEKIFGLDVAGNFAYLATQRTYGGGAEGLRIIDLSDPAVPSEVGFLDTYNDAFDVFVSDNHAFVAAGISGLRVIDVSVPTTPVQVGFVDPSEQVFGVEVSGNHAYVATKGDGIVVIDVTLPTAPSRVNRYDTRGMATLVAADGDVAFMYLWGERLFTLDVSNPGTPTIEGAFVPACPAQGILLEGPYAYVLAAGNPDVRIFDMANPSAPTEVGVLQTMGSWIPRDIAISGDCGYLPMQGGHSYTGVQIIDISDPTAPLELSYLETSGPQCVAAGGDFAYLGDYNALWVVDATDPENPHVASTLGTPGKVEDVVLRDGYVFMVCSEEGLRIANVSDPYSPQEVGFCDTPGQAVGLFLWDQYAYVADGTAGLRVIDVADPTQPVEVGHFDTFDFASSVYLANGRIFVADENDGLYILQNDLMSGVPENNLPAVTCLNNIYPNPFNPQMSVGFSLVKTQHVRIAVFDISGNRISVIADRIFELGPHSVQWNGRDAFGRAVSSGVYLVQMDAAGLSESQKVTLLR